MSIFTSKIFWKFLIKIQLLKSYPKRKRGGKCPGSCQLGLKQRFSQFLLQYFLINFSADVSWGYSENQLEKSWKITQAKIMQNTDMYILLKCCSNYAYERTLWIINSGKLTQNSRKLTQWGPSLYYTSAKGLGGWGQKNGNFCWHSVLFMLT